MNQAEWKREWNKVKRQEYEFLSKGRFKKETLLNSIISNKVPDNLQDKLDAAFSKAFEVIFEKGTGIIEKTYDKDGIMKHFENMTTGENRASAFEDRRSLKYFARKAGSSKKKNVLFTGASGIGMGVLGIGIPDIAVFTGTMLKGIYEIALNFGYEYDTPEEKYFILKIIQTSMSYGSELDTLNDELNDYIDEPALPEDYDQSAQIAASSDALSKELLYMKFLQGITIVGAIGGAYDPVYLKKILRYAELKYHRRFLLDLQHFPTDGPDIA